MQELEDMLYDTFSASLKRSRQPDYHQTIIYYLLHYIHYNNDTLFITVVKEENNCFFAIFEW